MTGRLLRDHSEMALEVAKRAQPAFQLSGWTYRDAPEPPTVEELQETVSGLLERVVEMGEQNPGNDCSCATGRFSAYRYIEDCYVVIGVDLNLADVHEEASREVIDAKYAEQEQEVTVRVALWRCYELTGADTSGDDHDRDDWLCYAVENVERLRTESDNYGEALDRAINALERVQNGALHPGRNLTAEIVALRGVAQNPEALCP